MRLKGTMLVLNGGCHIKLIKGGTVEVALQGLSFERIDGPGDDWTLREDLILGA